MFDNVWSMLAAVVEELEASETTARVARLRSIELEIRRLEAELAACVGSLDRAEVHRVDGHASLRGFLRAELRWSEGQITNRLRTARLVNDLPDAMQALWAGEIGVAQVYALAAARANPR